MKRSFRLRSVLLLAGMTMLLFSGCGGGSGNPAPTATVRGVAAAGAPIIGFAYLKDSMGTMLGPKEIASDGSFSFDVTGLTAPFMLKAEGNAGGQGYEIYSYTSSDGTANINPLSNVVVTTASGGMSPTAVFGETASGSAPDLTSINQTTVDAAIADIKQTLSTLLTAFQVDTTSFDPIKATYVADVTQNKLDAMFEAVKIQVNPDQSTGEPVVNVINKLDNTTILQTAPENMAAASVSTDNIPTASEAIQIISESQQIIGMLTDWVNTINSKGTSITEADVDKYYYGNDSTFGLQMGYTRTQFIQNLLSGFQNGTFLARGQLKSISNFGIVRDVTATVGGGQFAKVYEVNADFILEDGSFGAPDFMTVVKVNSSDTTWKFIGNGAKAGIWLNPFAYQEIKVDGTSVFTTGLNLGIEDNGNQGVKSASVEGPGLPGGKVTLSIPSDDNNLALDSVYRDNSIYNNGYSLRLTDTQIAEIAAAPVKEYTIKLYNTLSGVTVGDSSALMQILKVRIAKEPVTNAELASKKAALFPSFTVSGLTHQLSSLSPYLDKEMPFTYALSTLYKTKWLELDVETVGPSGYQNIEKGLALNRTADSILNPTPSFIPGWCDVNLNAEDSGKRDFRTIWYLQ